ncbi:hypothetical protein [Lysobacter sp. Root690]|uniref:hypothetical protein n=1 Tax=Lysobacter sp. Root690 TaxID=1736588 RepID=UPI0006F802E6|nr:hypothetical protein [Lysobacter sp. Root690]KRB04070.1 hypothetical protein ASD86_17130 [Lysobacter sp. Root690]
MSTDRSEPTLFRLFGAPVSFHWSVLLIVLLALLFSRDPATVMSGIAAYLSLIVAHEAGHAWVARHNRLRVYALRIFPLHGLCSYEAARTPGQEIAVAWGGVGAQMLLFALAIALSLLSPHLAEPLRLPLGAVVLVWGPMNLLNAILNLLPIAPLDGRTAWGVLPWALQRLRRKRADNKPSVTSGTSAPSANASSKKAASNNATSQSGSGDKVVSLDERRKQR